MFFKTFLEFKYIKTPANFDHPQLRLPIEAMVTGSSPNRNNFVSSSIRSGVGISAPLAGSESPSRNHFEPHRNDLAHVQTSILTRESFVQIKDQLIHDLM